MRFLQLVAISLLILVSAPTLAQQQTLYMQPGRPGHFTTTPPPPSGTSSPRGVWDGGVMIVPGAQMRMNVPSAGVPKSNSKANTQAAAKPSSSQSSSGSRMGIGIEVDIQGGRDLARNIEAAKAYEAYINWLNTSTAQINKFYGSQPRFARQLQAEGYVPKAEAVLSPDQEQIADFNASGDGLVMVKPLDRAGAANLLRSIGIGVATSTSEEEAAFSDVYEQFRAQEIHYHSQLIQEGRASTLDLAKQSAKVVRAADQGSQELIEIHSEFSGREEVKPAIPQRFARRAEEVDHKINRIEMTSPQGADFKVVARSAYSEFTLSASRGENEDAEWYLNVAEGIADVAIGIDPVSGFYRSVIESVTGYNVVTREKLSTFERSLAVFGVLTAGTSSSIQATVRLVSKLGAEVKLVHRVIQATKASGQNLDKIVAGMNKIARYGRETGKFRHEEKILEGMTEAFMKKHPEMVVDAIKTADELNLEHITKYPKNLRPYHAHTFAVAGRLKSETRFIRFADKIDGAAEGVSNPIGKWISLPKDLDISKMSPEDIQKALSLPYVPKVVVEVRVPAGTLIEKSYTSTINGGVGKHVQYELKEFNPEWFGSPRFLK